MVAVIHLQIIVTFFILASVCLPQVQNSASRTSTSKRNTTTLVLASLSHDKMDIKMLFAYKTWHGLPPESAFIGFLDLLDHPDSSFWLYCIVNWLITLVFAVVTHKL